MPKKKRTTVDLSKDEHIRFTNAKMRRGVTLQALMIEATEKLLAAEAGNDEAESPAVDAPVESLPKEATADEHSLLQATLAILRYAGKDSVRIAERDWLRARLLQLLSEN